MAPEFPTPDEEEEYEYKLVPLKKKLWKRLKEIGAEQKPKRSRPKVIEFFLEWAVKDYDAATARKKR